MLYSCTHMATMNASAICYHVLSFRPICDVDCDFVSETVPHSVIVTVER